jgi:shikimate O-hydroxycinnamoyltransferase
MAALRATLLVDKRLHAGATCPPQTLTGLDIFSGHIGIPVILVYRQGFDIARAEQALVATLAQYSIITGRFRKGADGHAYVDGSDAGIDYRVHRVDTPMPAYGLDRPMSNREIRQFHRPFLPWQLFGKDMPLLQVDIWQYACGGIVLCCYGAHSLFDGAAYWQFMQDWSRACRGEVVKAAAFDHDTVIQAGLTGAQPDGNGILTDPPMGRRLRLFARLGWLALTALRKEVIRVPAAQVQRWKDQAKAVLPPEAGVSTVELVAAHCMQVLSPQWPAGKPRTVGIVLDLRHKRRLRIPRDYFGNALCWGEVRYAEAELAGEGLPALAQRCRPAPEQVSNEALWRLLALIEQYRQKKAVWRLFWGAAGDTLDGGLILNNCIHFPMYDIDLGGGVPDWYDICGVAFRMLMVVNTPQKDGGVDLHFTATRAELAAVRQSLAKLAAASAARGDTAAASPASVGQAAV